MVGACRCSARSHVHINCFWHAPLTFMSGNGQEDCLGPTQSCLPLALFLIRAISQASFHVSSVERTHLTRQQRQWQKQKQQQQQSQGRNRTPTLTSGCNRKRKTLQNRNVAKYFEEILLTHTHTHTLYPSLSLSLSFCFYTLLFPHSVAIPFSGKNNFLFRSG